MATGVGATTGGMVGAAAGAVAGPLGAVVGAAIGAVAGGLVGKAAATELSREEAYRTAQYQHEAYYQPPRGWDDYAAAYRSGYEGFVRHPGKAFDDVEAELERAYYAGRGDSIVDWDEARRASRAAWERMQRSSPYQADN